MADGFTDDFLSKLNALDELEAKQNTFDGRQALQKELSTLNLYQVAANASQDRDPKHLGEIEQLLRTGNTEGLRARLGDEAAFALQDEYVKAWKQVEADKNRPRSPGEVVQDVIVGVPASIINTIWAGEMLAGGIFSPEYMAFEAERNQDWNRESVDPKLSEALKARRRIKQALDAGDEREHKAQADAEIADLGVRPMGLPYEPGAWFAQGKRVTKDIWSGIENTAGDPTLLSQGLAEAITSMGSAAVVKKGLEATGKAVLKSQIAKIAKREAVGETAEGILGKIGQATIKGLNKNMDALSWAGANAALEGTSAYQGTVADVLLRPIEELEKTSEDFRARVAELEAAGVNPAEARRQAKNWLAHKTGLVAAGVTGVAAAGLSHVIGQPGKAPTKVVTGSLLRDVIEEGIEEGLQGASGGLVSNIAIKSYVDPKQDALKGVGLQAGEGALLGLAAAGVMKTPGAIVGAKNTAGELVTRIADKRIAKAQAESRASVENLITQSEALVNDPEGMTKLVELAAAASNGDEAVQKAVAPIVQELLNSPVVTKHSDRLASLSEENRNRFADGETRIEAVNTAAELLLTEKNPEEKTKLALLLNELLEPVRRFREIPSELQALAGNSELMERVGAYTSILGEIEKVPVVKKAMEVMEQVFDQKIDAIEITEETLATPEGQQAAQKIVAQATTNPSLNGKASSKQIETILAMAKDDGSGKGGKIKLTETQRRALEGALALIKAREALEATRGTSDIQSRHLGTTATGTKSQAEVAKNVTVAIEGGRYSAKQHTDGIIRAMMAGDKNKALALIKDYALFVEHMQNKVAALNESAKKGGTNVAYRQLKPDRTWAMSDTNPENYKYKYAFLNDRSERSIALAQEVDAEAKLLHDILTNLAQAFELEVKIPDSVRLDPGFRGSEPSKLAKANQAKFNAEQKKAQAKKSQSNPQVTYKPAPVKTPAEKVTEALDKAAPTPSIVQATAEIPRTSRKGDLDAAGISEASKNEITETVKAAKPKNEVRTEPSTVREAIESILKKYFSGLDREGKLRLYFTDQATGLLNRRAAETMPRDPSRPFLAIFSLEGKKFLNDEHTHTAFDGALRVMARSLVKFGITDGMKIGGDVQAWVSSEAEAEQIAKEMSKQFPGFQVIAAASYTDSETTFKDAIEQAYQELDGKMAELRADGAVSWRKAPPVAFMTDAPNIAWEDNQDGLDIKSPEARAFIEKVKKQTADFGAKMRAEQTPVKLALPKTLKATKLSDEQMYQEAFYDPNTGLLTLQGWETVYPELLKQGYAFASIDMRALKPMNDAEFGFDKQGADQVLYEFGQAINEIAPGMGAWLHGDEFAIAFPNAETGKAILQVFEALLAEKVLYRTIGDVSNGGKLVYLDGLQAAWGVGSNFDNAESDLATRKETHDANNQVRTPVTLTGDAAVVKLAELQASGARALESGRARVGQEAGTGSVGTAQKGGSGSEQARAPVSITDLYSKLVGKLKDAFRMKRGSTRVLGKNGSVKLIQTAVADPQLYKEFLGTSPRGELTREISEAYYHLLSVTKETVQKVREWKKNGGKRPADVQNIGGLMTVLHSNLDRFLQKELYAWLKKNWDPKSGKTLEQARQERLAAITGWSQSKVVNLVEFDENGRARYNPELLGQAAMAALQWQLVASQRQSPIDPDDLAKDLNLPKDFELDTETAALLAEGEGLHTAKQSLANYIRRFWGVQSVKNQPMGYTDGIPEAFAAEMLRAMEELGLVEVRKVQIKVPNEAGDLETAKTIHRYVATSWGNESPLYKYRELLEEAVMIEPEFVSFYGDAEVPVAQHQIGNPKVKTSAKMRKALKNMQAQQFFLNMPMVNALLQMSSKDIIEFFGTPLPESEHERKLRYNKNDLISIEGANLSLVSALQELKNLFAEMQTIAAAQGIPVEQLGKKYQYAVSAVNRIMMQGAHNPQANKLMREAILPTWSTLDLSDESGPHYRYLMLALAQALGQKIHRKTFDENVKWAHDAITTGDFVPAIEVLVKYQEALESGPTPFPIAEFKAALPVEANPLVTMALTEMARLKRASPEQRKAFRTPMYLESDGMTNGPFNSMGLLASGPFTAKDVENWKKGGLHVGRTPKTSDTLIVKDLYETFVSATHARVNEFVQELRKQKTDPKPVIELQRHLFKAMTHLLDGEVKMVQDETTGRKSIVFTRALGKNPMTVLVYGSGVNGISNKLAEKLMKGYYAKLSIMNQGLLEGLNEAERAKRMFPKLSEADAVTAVREMHESMNALTGGSVNYFKNERGSGYFVGNKKADKVSMWDRMRTDPSQFTFSRADQRMLQQNLKTLIVKPMERAARDVLGESVFTTRDLIVKATTIQANVARGLFMKAIQDKIANKVKALVDSGMSERMASNRVSSEFLSRAELDEVWNDLVQVMPIVESDSQNFLIAKEALLEFMEGEAKRELYRYSQSLDEGHRTGPNVKALSDPGVAGIAYLVQGLGDGRMVRKLFEQMFEGSMQVFDGINIPIDRIAEYGSRINEAALVAWKGNLLQDLVHTFETFAANPTVAASAIAEDVNATLESLKKEARRMAARQAALNKYALSIDQMAGTYQPFVSEGEDIADGTSDDKIAELLNAEYLRELDRLEAHEKPLNLASLTTPERAVGGVVILTKSNLSKLPNMLGDQLTENERQTLNHLIKSEALRGTTVVIGSREDIAKYQEDRGMSSLARAEEQHAGKRIYGFFAADEQTVYLLDPKAETLIHELVHAATYSTVLAYYEGRNLGPNGEVAAEAIVRLENLLKLFLESDFGLATTQVGRSLLDAQREIRSYLPLVGEATPAQKASALNEFMAWTLANRELTEELSKRGLTDALSRTAIDELLENLPENTSTQQKHELRKELMENSPSRLARITRAAYEAIKKLIWRRSTPPAYGSDITSQIRFNTVLLAQFVPTLESQVEDIVHAHAVLNGTQDAKTRAGLLLETFGRKVARHLTQTYSTKWLERLGTNRPLHKHYQLAAEITQQAKKVFNLTQEQGDAFQMMVLAMATKAEINPQMMIEAQKIFDRFLSTVKQSDFHTGKGDFQNDEKQAQDKLDFLFGHSVRSGLKDTSKRSTLLPVFIGLASVSDEFRQVLGKMSMPGKDKKQVVGLDTAITAVYEAGLDKLEDILADATNQTDNVRDAIDQLTQGVIKSTLEARETLEDRLGKVNKLSYGLNTRMKDMIQKLGAYTYRKGAALQTSNSEFSKKMGSVLKAISFIVSEEDAAAISEEILVQMDKNPDTWEFVRDFISDVLGRVESQAKVYDMLKKVRAVVAQTRQAFREKVPFIIESKFKFKKPSEEQWNTLYRMMGRFDLASLFVGRGVSETLALVQDPDAMAQEVARLESELQSAHDANQVARYLAKIDQLVKFIQTGIRGPNLLRNAYAIAELLGEPKNAKTWTQPTSTTIEAIDQLVTLKLFQQVSKNEREQFNLLLETEPEGMQFILNYLKGLRRSELAKALEGPARYNHYKGMLPVDRQNVGHLTVADDSEHEKMVQLGYTWAGPYKGSSIEAKKSLKSYYFSPAGNARTTFSQGIAQNIQQTAYGVHLHTGYSIDTGAGLITEPAQVSALASQMHREAAGPENLSPVYGVTGQIIAFERSMHPDQMKQLEQPQNLAKIIGQWKGRQVEEVWASKVNKRLVEYLHEIWQKDISENPGAQDQYVNLFDTDKLDPVIRDAVSIFPHELKVLAKSKFGNGKFYVRRNMLNSVIGYRNASVGDMWTGNTRFSKDTQEAFQKAMIAIFGINAYRKLVWAERNWQDAMASIRTNIVVRSMIVPAANFVSGIFQLRGRGVPLLTTLKKIPAKVAELEFYSKSMDKRIELQAELDAAEGNVNRVNAIKAQIQALEDSLRRLSIWPLIEAGEFSTIADIGQTSSDLGLGKNTWVAKLTQAVDKLPPGLRDIARQGYMARDTALFQLLQKSVQYSDFVMKAVYFDHMTKVEKLTPTQAKARITEEFNNYDVPTGRTRGYIENMGLAWFLNYKIRAVKVALSMIRNNPLDVLLYSVLPHPFNAGIPVTDNLVAKLFELSFGYMGPGMAVQPIALNPWYNLIAD